MRIQVSDAKGRPEKIIEGNGALYQALAFTQSRTAREVELALEQGGEVVTTRRYRKAPEVQEAEIIRAKQWIYTAEQSLERKLSDGERRDLLMDNTSWSSDFIFAVVDNIAGASMTPPGCVGMNHE